MKLSNLKDEDLQKISLLKTRKGTATSEARRAQQILYTRYISHGGFVMKGIRSHIEANITRDYQSFEEVHGCSLDEYLLNQKKVKKS